MTDKPVIPPEKPEIRVKMSDNSTGAISKLALCEKCVATIWSSKWVGVLLWFTGAFLCFRWLSILPTPGKAIGALAVVAGIMSVRDMKATGKIAWVILLICLVLTEFRAIDSDRADSEQKQREFFAAEEEEFRNISSQAQSNFAQTTSGLDETINGLNTTIKLATDTLHQTEPHADVIPTLAAFANPIPQQWVLSTDTTYQVNFFWENVGSAPGLITKRMGRIYVAKADDQLAQEQLDEAFEKEWRKPAPKQAPSAVAQGVPGFWTESLKLTRSELEKLRARGSTIYFIRRIEYTDGTGKWRSDHCDAFQTQGNQVQVNITHPCDILMKSRYKATYR